MTEKLKATLSKFGRATSPTSQIVINNAEDWNLIHDAAMSVANPVVTKEEAQEALKKLDALNGTIWLSQYNKFTAYTFWLEENYTTIRAALQTPSVPMHVAEELARCLRDCLDNDTDIPDTVIGDGEQALSSYKAEQVKVPLLPKNDCLYKEQTKDDTELLQEAFEALVEASSYMWADTKHPNIEIAKYAKREREKIKQTRDKLAERLGVK